MKIILTCALIFLISCQPALDHQPRYGTYARSSYFPDQSSSRLPPLDTVSYHSERNVGKRTIDEQMILRGQERFYIFCSVCHGLVGDAEGMMVKRGFSPPPSFHTDEARKKSIADIEEIITNGRGRMTRLGDRIPAIDRRAIAVFVKVLQKCQHVAFNSLSKEQKEKVEAIK